MQERTREQDIWEESSRGQNTQQTLTSETPPSKESQFDWIRVWRNVCLRALFEMEQSGPLVEFSSWAGQGKRGQPVPVIPGWLWQIYSCASLGNTTRGLTPWRWGSRIDLTKITQAVIEQINKQITVTSPKGWDEKSVPRAAAIYHLK